MPEHGAIIDGVTGSFFKENDIEDLAHKIWKWISKSDSDREKTRDIARLTIKESWSVDYQIKLLKTILK